tara:strand:+ start:677 stop:790 length:114 start_codon:yes stop_codon:yes gene_type:complete
LKGKILRLTQGLSLEELMSKTATKSGADPEQEEAIKE